MGRTAPSASRRAASRASNSVRSPRSSTRYALSSEATAKTSGTGTPARFRSRAKLTNARFSAWSGPSTPMTVRASAKTRRAMRRLLPCAATGSARVATVPKACSTRSCHRASTGPEATAPAARRKRRPRAVASRPSCMAPPGCVGPPTDPLPYRPTDGPKSSGGRLAGRRCLARGGGAKRRGPRARLLGGGARRPGGPTGRTRPRPPVPSA